MSAQDIASASGISVTLIRRLLRPTAARPARISRTTADGVLGIPITSPMGARRLSAGHGLTEAANAAAILAEFASAGWPATRLAALLATSTRTVAAIRDRQRPRISIRLDQRIRRLHRQLAASTPETAGIRPADAARTRTRHQYRSRCGQ
jgi:hypothetical protein